jgi:hypothetical protein
MHNEQRTMSRSLAKLVALEQTTESNMGARPCSMLLIASLLGHSSRLHPTTGSTGFGQVQAGQPSQADRLNDAVRNTVHTLNATPTAPVHVNCSIKVETDRMVASTATIARHSFVHLNRRLRQQASEIRSHSPTPKASSSHVSRNSASSRDGHFDQKMTHQAAVALARVQASLLAVLVPVDSPGGLYRFVRQPKGSLSDTSRDALLRQDCRTDGKCSFPAVNLLAKEPTHTGLFRLNRTRTFYATDKLSSSRTQQHFGLACARTPQMHREQVKQMERVKQNGTEPNSSERMERDRTKLNRLNRPNEAQQIVQNRTDVFVIRMLAFVWATCLIG